MPDRELPTFFLLGAPKAGTTALYAMLKQHPDVFLPARKEPHYFAYRDHPLEFGGPADVRIMRHMVIQDEGSYRSQYCGRPERATGDASAMQLYVPGTSERIRAAVPDARLIAILRDPVQRAFSSWLHLVRDDRETLSFEDALDAEDERIAAGWIPLWHYRRASRYAEQLERWFDVFPVDQILILFHDELRSNSAAVLGRTFTFLGVDPGVPVATNVERNVSGIPRSRRLQRILSRPHPLKDVLRRAVPGEVRERTIAWLRNRNVAHRPEIQPATAERLRDEVTDDVVRLEAMLRVDLSRWRS